MSTEGRKILATGLILSRLCYLLPIWQGTHNKYLIKLVDHPRNDVESNLIESTRLYSQILPNIFTTDFTTNFTEN